MCKDPGANDKKDSVLSLSSYYDDYEGDIGLEYTDYDYEEDFNLFRVNKDICFQKLFKTYLLRLVNSTHFSIKRSYQKYIL